MEWRIEKIIDYVTWKATGLLEHGNPFNFFIKCWENDVAVTNGDIGIGAATACCVASTAISNSNGLHQLVGGYSGLGKSTSVIKMLKCFPEHKSFVSDLSPKALYYKEDLQAGTVIYIDDIDITDTFLLRMIKQSCTQFQAGVHREVAIGGAKSVSCDLPARLSFIGSSVNNSDDVQIFSRFMFTEVDADTKKFEMINQKQRDTEFKTTNINQIDVNLKICHKMWEMIEEDKLKEIRIPYVNAIVWKDIRNTRNFPMFKDIIRCMTLFKIKQRECVNGFYLSTVEDFEQAKDIYKIMEKSNGTKLNKKERRILEFLVGKDKVSRSDVVRELNKDGYGQTNIINTIHGDDKRAKGMLNKISGLFAEQEESERGGLGKWYYSYSGTVDGECSVIDIVLDIEEANTEICNWFKQVIGL